MISMRVMKVMNMSRMWEPMEPWPNDRYQLVVTNMKEERSP
jgi:hypothetical protein